VTIFFIVINLEAIMTAPVAAALRAPSAISATPRPAASPLAHLLHGAIAGPLLRLAFPTILVLIVQTFVNVAETYFVGHLGTSALAGVSLVFPVLMLMTMMSNGGIGGGVSSAVARALGGGRRHDADALVTHAVVLAVVFGAIFTAAVLGGGELLYRALGGSGAEVDAARQYSLYVFGGAILIWTVNLLSAALRGAGDVRVPALVIFAGAVIVVPLSPALIFGLGPLPHLGIAGAGAAMLLYYLLALTFLVLYMRSPRSPVRLAGAPLRWPLFREILGVGGLSSIGAVQANLTVATITSLVGAYGAASLAGYGIASRLDYLLIPLLFGLGTATVTMVGANIGAGHAPRARRIAWTAGLMAAGATELIGLVVAIFPTAWLGLFSDDPGVLATGTLYLRTVAPFYGLVGLGMALYFASQGAKRVGIPVLAGTARLVIAAGLGWIAVHEFGAGLPTLFTIVALSSFAFGGLIALYLALKPWR
jgi:putative MATE family efflux protein